MKDIEKEIFWRGFKLCIRCKTYRPIITFGKHKGHKFNLSPWCKDCRNVHVVSTRHKLTQNQLKDLFKKQANKCAICSVHKSKEVKGLAVDHNHNTGEVRGLLCCNCNNGLGRFKDNIKLLEKAIVYLSGGILSYE